MRSRQLPPIDPERLAARTDRENALRRTAPLRHRAAYGFLLGAAVYAITSALIGTAMASCMGLI